MGAKRVLYGAMGFLSLLGLIGVFTEERVFLAFFAFAVDFEYFFLKTDEMVVEYTNRAASRAFYGGMVATAFTTLACFFLLRLAGTASLLYGFAAGWGTSVAVHGLSIGYYRCKEGWGLERDPK